MLSRKCGLKIWMCADNECCKMKLNRRATLTGLVATSSMMARSAYAKSSPGNIVRTSSGQFPWAERGRRPQIPGNPLWGGHSLNPFCKAKGRCTGSGCGDSGSVRRFSTPALFGFGCQRRLLVSECLDARIGIQRQATCHGVFSREVRMRRDLGLTPSMMGPGWW